MAGNLALKTGTAVTITSTGAALTTGTAVSAGTIDLRSGGTANLIEQLMAFLELTCQITTITGVIAGTIIADAYLVPALDGTNYVDVDTTGGASYIASNFRVGSFVSPKQLVTLTTYRFATPIFDLFPALYSVYILNRSGETINASGNWTLKILAAEAQYT